MQTVDVFHRHGFVVSYFFYQMKQNTTINLLYLIYLLDRDDDCLDRSDEMHCSARQCPPHMYPCNVTGQCIDITKICNGQQDCADGTDESSQCGK